MSDSIMPTCATTEMLEFLDDLRISGITNMFGAAPYLQRTFKLSAGDSRTVLVYWMETFSTRNHIKGGSECVNC